MSCLTCYIPMRDVEIVRIRINPWQYLDPKDIRINSRNVWDRVYILVEQ